MIRNLRETTQRNREIDWLKTNIARFGQMLQGQRDLRMVGRLILTELAPLVGIQRGVFYLANRRCRAVRVSGCLRRIRATSRRRPATIAFGEGCSARWPKTGGGSISVTCRRTTPISSALGGATPRSVVLLPILFEDETRAVIELASIEDLSDIHSPSSTSSGRASASCSARSRPTCGRRTWCRSRPPARKPSTAWLACARSSTSCRRPS